MKFNCNVVECNDGASRIAICDGFYIYVSEQICLGDYVVDIEPGDYVNIHNIVMYIDENECTLLNDKGIIIDQFSPRFAAIMKLRHDMSCKETNNIERTAT